MDEKRIESLLTEREGYVRRGLVERVEQVDADLERFGYKPEPAEQKRDTLDAKPRTRRA